MDAADAIYTKGRAAILGDSGAGGLSNSATAFYIRGGVRRGTDPERTEGRPFIRVEVQTQERSREQNGRQVDALARFKIADDRDAQREGSEPLASQAADRLATLLNGVIWNTDGVQSGWSLSAALLRTYPLFDGKQSWVIVEFRVHADR